MRANHEYYGKENNKADHMYIPILTHDKREKKDRVRKRTTRKFTNKTLKNIVTYITKCFVIYDINRHIFIQLLIMSYDLLLISNIDMKDVQILVQLYVSFYYIFFYFT